MLKNIAFRHRLIGAVFIISLGIIVIPAIFDRPAVDTLAVNESLPAAPSHEAWQDLSEIDYSFTELVGDLQEEEGKILETEPTEIAQAPQDDTLAPLVTSETPLPAPEAIKTPALAENTAPVAAPTPKVIAEAPAPKPEVISIPERGVATPAPAPTQAETVIATTEKLIAKNTWAVQLGAFSKRENAEALTARLKEKGYSAYISTQNGQSLARVLVGVEPDQQKAAELVAQLDREMHLKGIIVKL